MNRRILVAVEADPTTAVGPAIQAVGVLAYGYLPPYVLGQPATHARVGVSYLGRDWEDRWWLDARRPAAHLVAEHVSEHPQITWEVVADEAGTAFAAEKLRSLDGRPYDIRELLEQLVPFLAERGGVDNAEVCTSLCCLVLAELSAEHRDLASAYLSGNRHPERFLRCMLVAEGSLLKRVAVTNG